MTTTPAPVPTTTTPPPTIPGIGEQRGGELPGGNFNLTAPGGVIYDMSRGIAGAQGNVEFSYREFRVRADRGIIDYNKNQALMTGNLTVTARDAAGNERTFTGKTLVFNLDSGEWTLNQLEAVFPPELFPDGAVIEPLYVRDGVVEGDYEDATGSNFKFSSCDRDHYYIKARRLDFFRDAQGQPDRIVLKNNDLYLLKQKVLPLPNYVISLKGARSRRVGLQPIFGQNAFDGYFVKTVYDLSANARRTDSLLIDALQKRGLGLGFQRELAKGAGLFYLYAISGKTGGRQIDSRIQRNWRISQHLNSTLNFQSSQNNSLTGEGFANRTGDLSFSFNSSRVTSNLLLSTNSSSSQFSSSTQQNVTFQHDQDFGANWRFSADTLYARSTNTGSPDTATLDNRFEITKNTRWFDAIVRTELRDDLTGRNQINGAYALERLPEVVFQSSTDRLKFPGINQLNSLLPGNISFAVGTFNEPESRKKLTRTDFRYSPNPLSWQATTGSLRSRLQATGNFEQAFYSDSTARYQYDYAFTFDTSLGRMPDVSTPQPPGFDPSRSDPSRSDAIDNNRGEGRVGLNMTYLKQRSVGFTPFQFDFFAPGEVFDATAYIRPTRSLRLDISAGRDIRNSFTRDIVGRVRFRPSSWLDAFIGASYSPELKTYGDILGNFRFSRDESKFLGGTLVLGVRYSPRSNAFSQINTFADISLGKKTRIQAYTGYNGISKQFDFNQIRVVRDLHCFNLYATYDQQRRELRFDIALKAFPFVDTRLGQTRFGEGFDPYVGEIR